jgi:hypothetical protein
MAQRHPATFGGAAGFSVAGGAPRRVRHHPGQRYALLAGRRPRFQLWLEQAPRAVGVLTADAA